MRLASIAYLSLFLLISCKSKPKVAKSTKCFVSYDSLFKDVDTSKFDIVRNTDSAAVEVLDSKKPGPRGLFRFDEKGDLRFYFFLNNDHNDTNFYIEYDSTGERKRSTSQEVVQWTFFKRKDSILRFEFYLCAIDYNFGDIQINAGKYKSDNIPLFETNFFKLIGAEVRFNSSNLNSTRKIFITGRKQDKCSKVYSEFIDSTTVPTGL
jgi:hypothetical protein